MSWSLILDSDLRIGEVTIFHCVRSIPTRQKIPTTIRGGRTRNPIAKSIGGKSQGSLDDKWMATFEKYIVAGPFPNLDNG